MVTVLQGEELQTLGARTVWDALPYVPGVQAGLDSRGGPSATVRGVAFPFNSGNIRIMIDGVPIARESAGQNIGSALYIPLGQVERLEFIRGPGSVVYGDFAFQGLLNIVTRKQDPRAYVQADSREGYGGGLMFNVATDGWRTSLNAAGSTTSDALLPKGLQGDEDRHSVFASLSRGGFEAQLNAVGRNLDITAVDRPGTDETNWSASSRYQWEHSEDLTGSVSLRYLHNDFDSGDANNFEGDEWGGWVEYNWTGWQRQDWLFGAEYSEGDIDQATFMGAPRPSGASSAPGGPPPPGGPPGASPPPGSPSGPPLTFSGDDREVVSLYAQGQIELQPTLHFIVGARYDDVDIIGERLTPRASLVWQAADRHIFKVQYAEGFRTPTFFERAGSSGQRFDFEVNKTTELSYIYRRPGLVFRGTVYDSRIQDMVFVDFAGGMGFANVSHAEAQGIELELSKRVGSAVTIEANFSAVDSEDNRNAQGRTVAPGAIPDWMTNIGVIWNVTGKAAVGMHWSHLADRDSAAPDSGTLDQVDLTLTLNDFLARGLQARIGVTNVLNDDAIHIVDGPTDSVFNYDTNVVWAQVTWNW
jgi:iron complex outermembrane receptor protein